MTNDRPVASPATIDFSRNEAVGYALLYSTIATNKLLVAHLKMQTLNRNVSTQIPEYSAFAEIYRFILRAVRGDSAVAKAIFERYLAGELSEELLTISRQCVEADRAERHMKGGRENGGCDAFTVVR